MSNSELLLAPGSFVPPTYLESFHDGPNEAAWIHRMPYRMLGKTGLPLSLLSYGGSALANYYKYKFSRTYYFYMCACIIY